MKSSDVHPDLKQFFKYFQKFSNRIDYSRAFDDFLTVSLTQFAFPSCPIGQEMHKNAISSYNQEEKEALKLMFAEMIAIYSKKLTHDGAWYDFFGDFYMELSSRSKSSAFGQFFTPDEICDMMNALTFCGVPQSGKKINDPACGSGRLILSHHVKNLGNFYVGEDLDIMCCKMTVLNFLLHGVVGEVWHHCSLSQPDTFHHRFVVNRMLNNGLPMPHVEIELNGTLPYERFEKVTEPIMQQATPVVQKPSKKNQLQLSFFD